MSVEGKNTLIGAASDTLNQTMHSNLQSSRC